MCPQLAVNKSIKCPLYHWIHLSAFSERETKREGKSVHTLTLKSVMTMNTSTIWNSKVKHKQNKSTIYYLLYFFLCFVFFCLDMVAVFDHSKHLHVLHFCLFQTNCPRLCRWFKTHIFSLHPPVFSHKALHECVGT